MKQAASYVDWLANKLNALELNFHGTSVTFTNEIVLAGIKKLCTDREQRIFSLRCDGYSLAEIGNDIGLSRARAGQILNKIERQLENRWMLYYPIPLADVELIINQVVDAQLKNKAIAENVANRPAVVAGYSIETFAKDVRLSKRTYNGISRAGIQTVEELIQCTPDEVMGWKNFGRKSYNDLIRALSELGLSLKHKRQWLYSRNPKL